eukprot:CAMPEP_0201519046 /NCGR_PEP_ID=MMETSP0161_2-20130828/9704_1 /ASSEMBLY_ACC=CAM_ASM_000251 /TAXON_ID=180227 /ORGANISM="Neoparamoeba aestuarina, Strain SoJaBio B1-5/56/2" /LENGTH=71 /DNA_ID=CAMNT_0047916967 /DNA_START=175 /DNA_END=387 /DNA_ORIENTATION=+
MGNQQSLKQKENLLVRPGQRIPDKQKKKKKKEKKEKEEEENDLSSLKDFVLNDPVFIEYKKELEAAKEEGG